jgi:hypothetical protein
MPSGDGLRAHPSQLELLSGDNASWVSALYDAELVAKWVGQDDGAIATMVMVLLDGSSSQVEEPSNFAVEVVDEEVEVGSVLHGLGFFDELEREVVKAAARGGECVEPGAVGEWDGFVVGECLLPEGCGDCDVDAVDGDADRWIHLVPLQ